MHPNHYTTVDDAKQMTRAQLIDWLVWNDPNGHYTDEDSLRDGFDPLDRDEAESIVVQQITAMPRMRRTAHHPEPRQGVMKTRRRIKLGRPAERRAQMGLDQTVGTTYADTVAPRASRETRLKLRALNQWNWSNFSEYGVSYHTCRFCKEGYPDREGLWKYGVRHYCCEPCRKFITGTARATS